MFIGLLVAFLLIVWALVMCWASYSTGEMVGSEHNEDLPF